MTTALIIGGGVAGPVAAMALQRAGIEAVVYEAHPQSAEEVGSYLTVATNGIDALRAIDADTPVLHAGFLTPTNLLYSGTGRRLGAVSNGGVLPDGTTAHTIKRARLYRVLHQQAAARGVDIQGGKRLRHVETTPAGGVLARFDDGTQAAGEVLIGADGVHSTTRHLIDPAAPAPRYVGLVNFGGYTPDSAGTTEPGAWHMIFGRQAFFGYVVDPDGGTVWFANVPRPAVSPPERAATTSGQWRRQLVELFAGDHGPAAELIAAGTLELAGDNTFDLPRVPTWHKGPMVVIGDAAHAPSPSSGQGASLAAEDAVVLAQCLRDLPDLPQALAAYERLRRARVERIVAQGARSSSSKTPGPVGRVLRDLLLPVVFKLLVTDKSLAWIYDHHIDWDTPTTPTGRSSPAISDSGERAGTIRPGRRGAGSVRCHEPGHGNARHRCRAASDAGDNQTALRTAQLIRQASSGRTPPELGQAGDQEAAVVNGHLPMNTPPIVSPQEWEAARQQLLVKEKQLTRARDALAAQRRRIPWLAVEEEYEFDGPKGKASLLEMFDGRRQLIVYRAFFEPGVAGWPEHACVGCSMLADHVAHLAHLNARNTTLVFVSRAPQPDIERVKARMGWAMPWYTLTDGFDADFGVHEWHGTNAFIRDGARVFRTYFINSRGDEAMGSIWSYLDMTALGRQEEWEDSPEGYPQTPPYQWWNWHDEYGDAQLAGEYRDEIRQGRSTGGDAT